MFGQARLWVSALTPHPAIPSKLWYLQRSGLLDVLNEQARQRLVQSTRILEVKRGQRVYLPGDPSDQIYVLKSGVIKIAAIGPGNREATLAFLYVGDIFGELAIVDDSPRDHLAQAHEDALLCAISRDVMLRLIEESPELGFRITKLMGLRVKQLHARLEQLLHKSAAARVAETLVGLASEHGVRDDRGVIVPFKLSQRELANLVGLTRETVNLMLYELRQQRLIEIDCGRIRLLDVQRLRAVNGPISVMVRRDRRAAAYDSGQRTGRDCRATRTDGDGQGANTAPSSSTASL